tara:strand:- start:1203 stop:1445 length:243 start_codon:yes stop_codon:yes gene_type:complete
MLNQFDIELRLSMEKMLPLRVLADLSPVEPDVGIMGNGETAVEILSVYCDGDGYDPDEDIMHCFSEMKLEELAHEIYSQL